MIHGKSLFHLNRLWLGSQRRRNRSLSRGRRLLRTSCGPGAREVIPCRQ